MRGCCVPRRCAMVRRFNLLALLVCIGGAGSLLGTGAAGVHAQTSAGLMRVVDMAPRTPDLDVRVDGQPVIPDLAFRSASSYVSVPPGAHTLELTQAGTANAAVVSGSVQVPAGQAQTIVVAGLPPA